MLLNIELVMEDGFDRLVFADDEGVAPCQTHEGPEDVVRFGDAFVRIRNQRKGHMEFTGKAALRIVFVCADADEVCARQQEFGEIVGKCLGFACAVGGERLRKEVDDRAESGLFGQHELRPLVCLGGDLGCPVTHFQRRHLDAAPS